MNDYSQDHQPRITGTTMDGGWFYAACSCGWKEGLNAYQSKDEAESSWKDNHADLLATLAHDASVSGEDN